MRCAPILIGSFLALASAAAAPAQEPAQTPPPPPVEPWPTLDVGDLWHKFRPKQLPPDGTAESVRRDTRQHFVVLAPAIGARPTTGGPPAVDEMWVEP